MNNKLEITLFTGEGLPEFTDRLGFILMELGIKFRLKEFHDDFVVFEFAPAEPLKNDDKK